MKKKIGIIGFIAGVVVTAAVVVFYVGNEDSQGSKATLEVLVWNDSQGPRIDVSVSMDENVVWEDNVVRERVLDNDTFLEVHPACKSFQISLAEGKHDLRAVSWADNLKVEREFEIEITDEDLWAALTYGNKGFGIQKSDDRPIIVS